ncbi:MAG: HAD family hydrolase [Candidatus Marsarchaeota archaeon]|nr:HAD family hydrolase [Candidatus Marsarchaeota archaeon]
MRILDRYDLFIFDWDGTIEKVMYMYRLNEKLNPFWRSRKRSSFREAITPDDSRRIKEQLRKLEHVEEEDERRLKRLLDIYMMFTKPKMQEGALAVLKTLHDRGKTLAVFSNGAMWRVRREIKTLRIEDYFDSMVSAQSIGFLKPNPIGIHLIMNRCRVSRNKTLYIGDMVDDIKTARSANVDSCGIAAGFDNYNALDDEKPTYLFRNMREFHKAL